MLLTEKLLRPRGIIDIVEMLFGPPGIIQIDKLEKFELLIRPSQALPMERFLTPNRAEDANNLYARMMLRATDLEWQGTSVEVARRTVIWDGFKKLSIGYGTSMRENASDGDRRSVRRQEMRET